MKRGIHFQIFLFFCVFTSSFALINSNLIVNNNKFPILEDYDYDLKQSSSIAEVFEWNRTLDDESNEMGMDLALDTSNNIYIAGYNSGTDEEVIILKYNSSGFLELNITWPTNQLEIGTGVALDSQDNIYFIAGVFNSTTSDYNITLVKYDKFGNYQWNVTWGGVGYAVGYDLTVDNSDDVYITGETGGVGGNLFIAKFNSSGHYKWHDIFGGNRGEIAHSVTHDSSDNVYIIGSETNNTLGTSEMLLVCYDRNGNHQWNKTWDNSHYISGSGIALDSLNNIYTVGTINNTISGDFDVVIVCFDNDSTYKWNQTWDATDFDQGVSITIDSQDYIYITGVTINYSSYDMDLFLLNYNSSGNFLLNRTITGPLITQGFSIIADSLNNIYITGLTSTNHNDYDIFVGKVKTELFVRPAPDGNGDENGQKILGFNLIFFLGIIFICLTIIMGKIRKRIN